MSSAASEPLLRASDEDVAVKQYLLLSHLATRMGTQAWFFCVPLFVMKYTPGTILGPGIFGLCAYGTGLLISPRLGSWADVADRLYVVRLGVCLQAVAVLGNSVLVFLTAGSQQSHTSFLPLLLACFFGMLEKMSFPLTDVPVKRDWVPVLLLHNKELLQRTNQQMSQIDLTTEVLAPFLAGLLIQFPRLCGGCLDSFGVEADVFGYIVVGLLNAASCFPQYLLLRKVHKLRGGQLARTGAEKAVPRSGIASKFKASAWRGWAMHPFGLPLLSMSYALLYITVLSPHGALFTAFMANAGVPATSLSLIRGLGAVSGLVGVSARPMCLKVLPERLANIVSVGALAAFMVGAAIVYQMSAVLQPTERTFYLYIFGLFVVMGRPGLYAFELGVLNQEQVLVDETRRAAVGAVDDALLSGFTLAIYTASAVFNKPEQFGGLVDVSAASVTAGCLTYILWCLLFHEHRHRHARAADGGHAHSHGEEHGHGHVHADHPHTTQVERCIDEDGFHTHLHFNPFWTSC
mmetsp:Transcript_59826/g.110768  ORF Transcript_59826/g.110768 Transcript_59826/m.110768 type:complete len:519 (-) Transcript_59826:105-1661(-)